MTGETELAAFLRQMEPHLHERLHVFCSVDPATYEGFGLNPLGMFREAEGITLTMDQWQADEAGPMCVDRWGFITLTVRSALTTVGCVTAICARLAAAGLALIMAGAI